MGLLGPARVYSQTRAPFPESFSSPSMLHLSLSLFSPWVLGSPDLDKRQTMQQK